MRWLDLGRFAALQLKQNRGRSVLTATGVAVGVFALTTIVAIGRGLELAVTNQLTDDESQTRIVVRAGFGPGGRNGDPIEVEGVTDPAKVDRLRKAIAKRRRGGPGQLRRTLVTHEALAAIASRDHVRAVRPFVIDRFELTLLAPDGSAPPPPASAPAPDARAPDDAAPGLPAGEGPAGPEPGEARGPVTALSYSIVPGDRRWARRVIAGSPFEAGARGVWVHEYVLYRWGWRTDAEQASLVGRTVRLGRSREASGLAAALEMARGAGLDVPAEVAAAEPMLRALAGRRGGAEAEAPVLSLDVPLLGVVRERVEEDGFEVWDDSFSMQADLFLPQPLAEELFRAVPSNQARGYQAAAVDVESPAHVDDVERALRAEGFGTQSVGTILERVGQALAIVTAVVSGLTAIALLVAVIGIVNTMIMNVSERTREIGTLKALGATDGQVRWMFVVESGLIGLAGGAVGIGLAVLGSYPGDALNRVVVQRMTEYAYPGSIFEFPPWLIGLSVGFALLLSVLAALWPATVASRIDPVEALRDE